MLLVNLHKAVVVKLSVELLTFLSIATFSGCFERTSSDIMKTTEVALYALRLTYSQPANREKMMSRSAFALAAIGLGLSTFSVRQMILQQTRRI